MRELLNAYTQLKAVVPKHCALKGLVPFGWNSTQAYRCLMNKTERNGESYRKPKKCDLKEYERALIEAGEYQGILYFDTEENINEIEDIVVLDTIKDDFYEKQSVKIRLYYKEKATEYEEDEYFSEETSGKICHVMRQIDKSGVQVSMFDTIDRKFLVLS